MTFPRVIIVLAGVADATTTVRQPSAHSIITHFLTFIVIWLWRLFGVATL